MKVELHGSPKEIAALIAELQRRQMESLEVNPMAVSYTHLTLPTILLV